MKKVINSLNFDPNAKRNFSKMEGVSETVPDQAFSVKELVARYTRSGDFGMVNEREPIYLGDDPVPNFERMTPQERIEYANREVEIINENRRDLKKRLATAKKLLKQEEAKKSASAAGGEPAPPDDDVNGN